MKRPNSISDQDLVDFGMLCGIMAFAMIMQENEDLRDDDEIYDRAVSVTSAAIEESTGMPAEDAMSSIYEAVKKIVR